MRKFVKLCWKLYFLWFFVFLPKNGKLINSLKKGLFNIDNNIILRYNIARTSKKILNWNEKDFSSKLKRDKGIYDYETQTYTKEKNKNISTKEIQETIQEKDVRRNRRLKYDSEELNNSSFSLEELNAIINK